MEVRNRHTRLVVHRINSNREGLRSTHIVIRSRSRQAAIQRRNRQRHRAVRIRCDRVGQIAIDIHRRCHTEEGTKREVTRGAAGDCDREVRQRLRRLIGSATWSKGGRIDDVNGPRCRLNSGVFVRHV